MSERSRRGLGIVPALLALIIVVVLLGHGLVPNTGGWASLFETALPWIGVPIALLLVAALLQRSVFAVLCVVASAAVWALLFAPVALPRTEHGTASVSIVSENLDATNQDPAATVADLMGEKADVVALQELSSSALPVVSKNLDAAYPHKVVIGTVGVWSTLPLSNARPLELGLGWKRAMRIDVAAPSGAVRLYAVHMASVRVGQYTQRNRMLKALDSTLKADQSPRIAVAGDFNSASTDRAFSQLTDAVSEAPTNALGFGFTWPAAFPVARLDHLLVRGMTTVSSAVLDDNGSDHRGISVTLR